MKPFKLTVAPNGARLQKSDHPCLPITIAETVRCAADCHAAGADEIHLHIRNADGSHSLDAGKYREAIAELKRVVPTMSVQITTESAGVFDVGEQFACLKDLQPIAASISVREMARDMSLAKQTYALCCDYGTKVQHILYTSECIAQMLAWRTDGTIKLSQNEVIFVLGHYNPPVIASPDHLTVFLNALQGQEILWTACAFGKNEHACLAHAVSEGGNIRIGFENNHLSANGEVYSDNAASINAFSAQQKQS